MCGRVGVEGGREEWPMGGFMGADDCELQCRRGLSGLMSSINSGRPSAWQDHLLYSEYSSTRRDMHGS